MKCSRSDSMTILGLLMPTLCSESNIFFIGWCLTNVNTQDPLTPQDPPLSSLLTPYPISHIVLQYIEIVQRMLHINKKQSYGFFSREINLLIKKLTSENDDNSRLERLRVQSAGRATLCTSVAIGGGGGGVSITRSSPIYFSPIISPRYKSAY